MDQAKTVNCPDCKAANQAGARYCEQCGALLDGGSALKEQPQDQRRGKSFNWTALVVLALIIAAIFWVSRNAGDKPGDSPPATSNQAANPHASPSSSSDVPDVTRILEESRGKLAADPLDTAALNEMYEMYAGIGEQEKMQPYAEAAIDAWQALAPEVRDLKQISDVAMIASDHNDLESAVQAFIAYHEAQPENLSVAATIGNIYFQISRRELPGSAEAAEQARLAIDWYDRFLAEATPETHAEQYWNVMVDKASMHISLLDEQAPQYDEVIALLRNVTEEAPEFWMGWHNLGLALKLAGQRDAAIEALTIAKEQGSPREAWESEQQLAILENREADPGDFDPTDPHSGVDIDSMDLPPAQQGMPNPHGQSGGSDDTANPHNMGTQG